MTTRRKLAIASWSSPKEANIYGKLVINANNILKYIEFLRKETGEKVTVTHLVARSIALTLKGVPDFNGRIVLGRYVPHKKVDLSFLVTLDGGDDLAKVKVCDVDKKKSFEIAKELRFLAERLRDRKDDAFEKSKPLLRLLPTWLIRPIVWTSGYITGALGFAVPALGLEAFPFGSCMITSVGMLGIDEGYAPPTPFARVPLLVVITRIKDEVVAKNKEIVIEPQLKLMATVDHRFMDGYQGASVSSEIKRQLEEPWLLDGYEKCPWH